MSLLKSLPHIVQYISPIGMILHMGYPTVTINNPSTTLSSGAVLYDFTVNNPTDEAIAVYRFSFHLSTSSGDLSVSSGGLQAKLSSWSSFKQIAADAAPTIINGSSDLYQSFVLYNADSTTQTKKELQIGAGQSAQFQYIARSVSGSDGTAGESIQVRLLGDTASSTGSVGNTGDAFSAYNQGNFTWSDLNSNTGSTASGASTTAQWYNGYLVEGLASTSTVKSLAE